MASGTAIIWTRERLAHLEILVEDRICGTRERLADAVHPGGSMRLKKSVWPEAGKAKCEWADRIAPCMDPDRNRSKNFQVFGEGIMEPRGSLTAGAHGSGNAAASRGSEPAMSP